jgi:hypothetical protein
MICRSASLLMLAALAAAQTPAPVKLVSPVQDKNFYLLSMLDRTPAVREAVKADPALARIAAQRIAALDSAVKSCNLDLDCYAAAFKFTEAQSGEAADSMAELYRSSSAVRKFTDGPLRASGTYIRYRRLPGDQFLHNAWLDCSTGINHMIEVFGLGKPPRYPAIDAITYDPKADTYRRVVQTLAAVLEDDRQSLDLFFTLSLRFAMELMLLNHRDEAGRFEPMETGENALAFQHAKSVEWNNYPYSVIVVPGAGNDRPGVRLSPGGKLRDEIAAKRFREGKAPFLIVSGGFVHPTRTEFSEAIEMKRDLIARLGVPADAIIVDPHARHTTTNMRNAARLMFRYGIPMEKKALVTSDPGQSQYIDNPAFDKRCLDELGYVPYKLIARTSPFDLEFLAVVDSLHIDPMDPLDPELIF